MAICLLSQTTHPPKDPEYGMGNDDGYEEVALGNELLAEISDALNAVADDDISPVWFNILPWR
ncbi:hypothetical protein PF004_g3918 [Phytophthora fragariae]|nr:hypothetical protein PR001_g11796 [Phytophthora rubi]KAE9248303.1 hypothetical protein PF004_g3918 [Phytophthora fragariae]